MEQTNQISRRQLLYGFGAVAMGGCTSRPVGDSTTISQPNILMLCIDDLNDWVGCLDGHPNTKTPNIDGLAQRGTLFANAHAQAPICGPSRASLMTGLLPSETGIYGHIEDNEIRSSGPGAADITFLPEVLSQAGYYTMGVGKVFHIGAPDGVFDKFGGRHPGFGPKPEKRFHWDQRGTSTDWGPHPASDTDMPDIRTARWASDQLAQRYDKPFFLAAGFLRPHVPWYVPQRWFDLHPIDNLETPPFAEKDWDDVPELGRQVSHIPVMPTKAWVDENNQWPAIVQAYLASVSFVDHCVGIVLKALDASPHAGKTVVILWSDHGYHLGEKGLFQKFTLWERSTRVPLIFAGPGVLANQRREEAVGLVDLYPTLADIADQKLKRSGFGSSLAPYLQGSASESDRYTITTYGPGNHAVRTGRYRYIRYSNGTEELYDHQEDPNEWVNLADDVAYLDLKQTLRAKLPDRDASWSPKSSIALSPYFKAQSEGR